jgi:hypothetical protein
MESDIEAIISQGTKHQEHAWSSLIPRVGRGVHSDTLYVPGYMACSSWFKLTSNQGSKSSYFCCHWLQDFPIWLQKVLSNSSFDKDSLSGFSKHIFPDSGTRLIAILISNFHHNCVFPISSIRHGSVACFIPW